VILELTLGTGLQWASDLESGRFGYMGVDLGGFQALVTQELLDVADVSAGFQQVNGEAVAQVATGNLFLHAGFFDRPFKDLLDRTSAQSSATAGGKKPISRLLTVHLAAQSIPQALREDGDAILVALDAFPGRPGGAHKDCQFVQVHVLDEHVHHFGNAQPGSIQELDHQAVLRVLNRAHNLENLVARENPGQFVFRARAADIGERIITAIEPHVEEFEGADGLVDP